MSQSYSIKYIYSILDKFSPIMDKMSAHCDNFAKKTHANLENTTKKLNVFGGALGAMFSFEAIKTGFEKVKQFGEEGAEIYKTQEVAIKGMEQSLKNTNGVSGQTIESLTRKARDFGKETIYSSQNVTAGIYKNLLLYSNITGDQFDKATQASIDITARLKGTNATTEDLSATSLMLGRALNNPAQGLERIARTLKVTFTPEQEKVIKALQLQHRTVEAQNIILGVINKTYAGSADALKETDAGMSRMYKNQIVGMKMMVGQAIVPLEHAFLKMATEVLPKLIPIIEKLPPIIERVMKIVEPMMPILMGILDLLVRFAPVILSVIGGILGFHAAIGVANIAMKAFEIGKMVIGFINLIKTLGLFRVVMIGVNIVMATNPIILIATAVALLITGIILLIVYWDKVKAAMMSAWDYISKMLDNPVWAILGAIFLPFITIPAMIIKHWKEVKELFGWIGDKIKSIGEFFGIGKNINVASSNKLEVPAITGKTSNVNVNSSMTAYAEKGTAVKKGEPSNKTGFQLFHPSTWGK